MRRTAAFAAIYLCWGATFLAIRFVVAEMPPLLAIAIRCAGGAVLFLLWLGVRGKLEPVTWAQCRTAMISGLFLFLGCHGLLAWIEQRVASGEAALLLTSIPLWMVAIEAIRKGTWPSFRVLLGLSLGVGGVAVLSIGDGWSGGLLDRVLLVLSGLSWVVGSMLGRDGERPRLAAQATAMQLLGGTAVLLVASTLAGEWSRWDPAALTGRGVTSMVFLIVGGTVIGFGAYNWLLRVASPGAVGTYAFVNPVVALLLAYLVGDGTITARSLSAMGLVLAAVVLSRDGAGGRPPQDKRREPLEEGSRLMSVASRT
jgi:drug/metabolite transporter (DMT)-like permease